jgi:glycosyltransferase involved in cell wall biosynthesis
MESHQTRFFRAAIASIGGPIERLTMPAQTETASRHPPVANDLRNNTGAPRSVLIVAWEYPGVHSRQGAALSRRIGQLARGFASRNWRVSVVHQLHESSDPAADSVVTERVGPDTVLERRAVTARRGDEKNQWRRGPLRRLATMWVAFRRGDSSGTWAEEVVSLARAGALQRPDLILGCFTPRGPLLAAERLHRFWGVPWIADLQDPSSEGSSRALRPIVAAWMRRVLRSAAMVVQVSPEWAASDARTLGRAVETQRHAIPAIPPLEHETVREGNGDEFVVLYAGSLDEQSQDLGPFMDALASLEARGECAMRLCIAGSEAVWKKFAAAAEVRGLSRKLRWLGWLNDANLRLAAQSADCLLLIPWFLSERRGVPSKLYEYLAFGRPTLIAGRDSGGVTRALGEWHHPPVVADTAATIVDALRRACRGDFSGMLQRQRCVNSPLSEDAFVEWYAERATAIVTQLVSHRR